MNIRRPARLTVLVLLAAGAAWSGRAETSLMPEGHDPSFWTVQLDNDLFYNTDHNYTNGVRASWVSRPQDPKEFNQVQRWLQKLSGDQDSLELFKLLTGFSTAKQLEYKYGFSLTQLMFTPTDLNALSAPPGQRPYAGWLGLGFSIHVQDESALNSVEFSLGTVGSNSLAQQAQDAVHGARKFPKFKGWASQVPNEVTANLIFTQSRKLRRTSPDGNWALDGFWEWGFSVGTFRTDAMTGALFRAGWNLPIDFSDPRLSLRSYSHQMAGGHEVPFLHWLSAYVLAGGRGTAVGHDTTLDGSLFRNDRTGVTTKWLVGEYYLGWGMRWGPVEFSYVDTFRTQEFKEQAEPQKYGSLTLRVRY